MTEEDVRKLLRAKIKAEGLRPFCREHGDLDPAYTGKVADGKKPLSPAILDALGIERVVSYRYRRKKS